MFALDLMSILPPFTLLTLGRFKGGLAKNIKTASIIAAVIGVLIYITGDIGQWCAFGIGIYAFFLWGQAMHYSDPPAYELIWQRPAVPLCVLAVGCAGVTLSSFGLWAARFAIRTYSANAAQVGSLIGIPGGSRRLSGASSEGG